MATTTTKTNKPILPRGVDNRPVDSYNRAELYSGKALDFDGVNDVVTTGQNLGNLQTLSIAMHCRIDNMTDGTARGVISQWDNSNGWMIYKSSGTSSLTFWKNGSSVINWDESTNYSDQWIHLVYVIEQGVGNYIYVNGVLVGSDTTNTSDIDYTNNPTFKVGAYGNTSTGFFNGAVGGVKVFNTALTAAQVADLYNNPEKVVPTGVANTALKLWLPMQEGAGTTAYDGSSTENGPNLIVNGDFATDSDWTKGAGWSIGGGVATHDSSLGAGDLYQDFSLTIGKSYKITIEITATDTTELYFMTDSGDYVEVTGSPIGVHSHIFVADDSLHRVGVRGSANWDGSVDNITLEELNFANHGTISGATWTHGIGAPVAQTAVIDWNKGVNLVEHSEEVDDAYFNKSGVSSIAANNIVAPDGRTTADKVNINSDSESGVRVFKQFDATQYTMSFYAKAGTQTDIKFYVIQQGVGIWRMDIDLINGVLSNVGAGISNSSITDVGDGWWRITATRTFTAAASNHGYGAVVSSGNGTNFYLWGFQHKQAATAGPYIPTFGSAQTSDVLLPQGLTTGRDITGVNLFENVRKQGALNLDGNSWAEVHDNTSLDFGTGSFTLEAWVKAKYVNQGSVFNMVISLGGNITSSNNAGLMLLNNNVPYFIYSNPGASSGSAQTEGDWIHIVGTYDETNTTLYVNGSQADQDARTASDITNGFAKVIGRDGTDPNRFYNDQIAQPRIYNRALTASEVLNNYNATKTLYI